MKKTMFVLAILVIALVGLVSAADTGLLSPSANGGGGWSDESDAYSSNNQRAVANSGDDVVQYSSFGMSIPAEAVITGIEVKVEGYTESSSSERQADISLSWNGALRAKMVAK